MLYKIYSKWTSVLGLGHPDLGFDDSKCPHVDNF